MGRIGFAMAAIGSIVLLAWFGYMENENNGFSLPMAIFGMGLLTALFGFAKSTATAIAKDGKSAAWAGLVIAVVGVAYLFLFKNSWVLIAVCWLLLQVPAVVAATLSPTAEDQPVPPPRAIS